MAFVASGEECRQRHAGKLGRLTFVLTVPPTT